VVSAPLWQALQSAVVPVSGTWLDAVVRFAVTYGYLDEPWQVAQLRLLTAVCTIAVPGPNLVVLWQAPHSEPPSGKWVVGMLTLTCVV
jgi:hypothetical protein